MWLFQISSAADNYIGKMQIAERTRHGTLPPSVPLAQSLSLSPSRSYTTGGCIA